MFGTDGVRGRAKWLLKSGVATYVAKALGTICPASTVVIGTDTRQSSPEIERLITSGLISTGVKALRLGVVPTPAVSFLTKRYGADFGVMITASHNPPEYNGIKIFGKDGGKLSAQEELEIENTVLSGKFGYAVGEEIVIKGGVDAYVDYVASKVNADFSGREVTVDCCHGATGVAARRVFEKLGAKTTVLCGAPSGELVGVYSGSTNIEYLKGNLQTKVGFAYDGDGDRVIAVADGKVLDGGKILYLLAKARGEKRVASTVMANGALEDALEKQGISLERSDVGDKNLSALMKEKDIELGAEPSGHVIVGKDSTGDGVLASALFFKYYTDGFFAYDEYPSVMKNVSAPPAAIFSNETQLAIQEAAELLAGRGRILVRPSGTEPVVRVYAEAKDGDLAQKAVQKVANALQFL